MSGHADFGYARGVRETPALDARILRAPLPPSESGVEGTTVNAWHGARRGAGHDLPALPQPALLITAAIRAAIGREPIHTSGDLERDLRRPASRLAPSSRRGPSSGCCPG